MKRKRAAKHDQRAAKIPKLGRSDDLHPTATLLRQYYPQLVTLRQYLASKLSTKRRRRLLQYGGAGQGSNCECVADVTRLLDSVLVGTFNEVGAVDIDGVDRDITIFTQQLSGSTANEISTTQGALKQSEVGTANRHSLLVRLEDREALILDPLT